MNISQSVTAIGLNLQTGFLGVGGTPPYTYSVNVGGAGGTINPTTGLYTSPTASTGVDVITVTGSLLGEVATTQIIVGTPIQLFCDILQNQMALGNGRVYLWDQKINQPNDNNLYIAVSIESCKPFGVSSIRDPSGPGFVAVQYVNMLARVGIDIISRGTDARDRKEEIIMALSSDYSLSQQTTNSFYIAPITTQFINLSHIDGPAIPYRFHLETNMQYIAYKQVTVPYFDTFVNPPDVTVDA